MLAPTGGAFQLLLDHCLDYANKWCIEYIEKKTKIMYFGKEFNSFQMEKHYRSSMSGSVLGYQLSAERSFLIHHGNF